MCQCLGWRRPKVELCRCPSTGLVLSLTRVLPYLTTSDDFTKGDTVSYSLFNLWFIPYPDIMVIQQSAQDPSLRNGSSLLSFVPAFFERGRYNACLAVQVQAMALKPARGRLFWEMVHELILTLLSDHLHQALSGVIIRPLVTLNLPSCPTLQTFWQPCLTKPRIKRASPLQNLDSFLPSFNIIIIIIIIIIISKGCLYYILAIIQLKVGLCRPFIN